MLRVLIAGATGWTGAPLAEAVVAADDLELAGGIARSGGATFSAVDEALAATSADVFVDYTSAAVVRENVDAALAGGAARRGRLLRPLRGTTTRSSTPPLAPPGAA